MTNEEAIKVLQREKDCVQQAIQKGTDGDGYVSPDGLIRADDYVEACTVAISALRQQGSCCKKCNDLFDEDGGEILHVETVTESHQMTNADRIRTMSDEELVNVVPCPLGFSMFRCPIERQCGPCKREWLQMPAEEDDNA